MRHRVAGYKLGRDTEHRKAMRRNLAIALFTHGQITTTVPKAKSVKPFVEKLITAARKGDLASRRRVIRALGNPFMVKAEDDVELKRNKYGEVVGGPRLVKQLFDEIAPRFGDRPGGYTRIVRLSRHRLGDGADLCVLQLVGDEEGPQVSGQRSRRRDMANRRMEFAAQRRRAEATDKAEAAKEDMTGSETTSEAAEPAAADEAADVQVAATDDDEGDDDKQEQS